MSGPSRIVSALLSSGLLLLVAASTRSLPAVLHADAISQTGDDRALQPLMKALADYVAMRERLYREVPRLMPNSEAREISAASDALARAIQRVRAKARQGDFFDKSASQVITRRLREAIETAQLHADLAAIDDEQAAVTTPRVHLRFPEAAPLATMLPSLLRVLPPLPEGLEYRIVGDALVLRDVNAALILDFIPKAVARK